jgi:hypothetical protein
MSVCRVCNAPILWAVTEGGVTVPLDDHEQRDYGPGRYRVAIDGTRPTVVAVGEESAARTYVDHRQLCQQPRAI